MSETQSNQTEEQRQQETHEETREEQSQQEPQQEGDAEVAAERSPPAEAREKREPPRRYRYFVENQLKQKSTTQCSKLLDLAETAVDKMTSTLGDINPFLSLERLRDDRPELRSFIYMFNFLIYMLIALNSKRIYHAIMCMLFIYPTVGGFLVVLSLLSEDAERAANIGRRFAFLVLSVFIDYSVKLVSFTKRNISRGFRPVKAKAAQH